MATLRAHDITDYDHGARQIARDDFDKFDYIFAMDAWNLRDIEKLQRKVEAKKGKTKAKVMLFGEYGGKGKAEEVGDPYYGKDNGFEEVYEQVGRFSRTFIKSIDEKS